MNAMNQRLRFGMAGLVIAAAMVCGPVARGGNAVAEFFGEDSYIALGSPASLYIGTNQPFTVEGWIYMRSIEGVNMMLSKNEAKDGSPYTFHMGFRDYYDYNLRMFIYSTSGGYVEKESMSYEPYRWYHVAFSFDGTDVSIYLDGELQITKAFSFDDDPTHNIYIGGYTSTTDIDGYKSDVRIWDVARTQGEIQSNMYHRLAGSESGLIGYWPLDDGVGDTAEDLTSNVNTGDLVNAGWAIRPELPLSEVGDPFVAWVPFTVADQATGSEDFTGSNQVDVADLPVPDGYDRYQITESGDISALGAWTATSTPPSTVSFTRPAADTNLPLYAWFTNATTDVTLRRSVAVIRYTTAVPVPFAYASLTRETAGFTVRITGWELDDGSTGGTTGGEAIPVHAYEASLVSGPWGDFTSADPYVTLTNQAGAYTLKLRVINEAGNSASVNCPVTIATAAAPPVDGDRYVAAGNLFAAAPYGTWATAAATIQDAVDASADTDMIRVAPGVYTDASDPVVTIDGNRTLKGWGAVEAVIIDGEMTRQGMSLTGPATVDGVTIMRGVDPGFGGGVALRVTVDSGVLQNSIIEDCHSTAGGSKRGGGGIWAVGTVGEAAYTAIVQNVTIRNCTHAKSNKDGGGGIFLRDCPALIEDCSIISNRLYGTQEDGGGICINEGAGGRTVIRNTLLVGNTSPSDGGGMFTKSPTLMDNCIIRGNTGGGAYVTGTTNVTIRNSLFYDNYARSYGGAVGFYEADAGGVLENCTIVSNRTDQHTSGGVHFYRNAHTGVIRNCIINENYKQGTTLANISAYYADMEVSYTCSDPLETGPGNTNVLPQFVNLEGKNFRLLRTSPCIDKGLYQDWMDNAVDLDGYPRLNGNVDMGAYEYTYTGTMITIQ